MGNWGETTLGPICSMYGIVTYIWLIFVVNVGKYTIHGWYKWSYGPLLITRRRPIMYASYLFLDDAM